MQKKILNSIKTVQNNIVSDCLWFWMLEPWIRLGYITDNTENPTITPKKIWYGGKDNDILENYTKIKLYFGFDNLPNLWGLELIKFVSMYYGG